MLFGAQHGLPKAISGHNSYYLWGPGDATGEVVIANSGEHDLVIIEVQTGSYLGEDDIVRLEDDFGVPQERLRVIPHGAFDYLTRQKDELPLPAELREVTGGLYG